MHDELEQVLNRMAQERSERMQPGARVVEYSVAEYSDVEGQWTEHRGTVVARDGNRAQVRFDAGQTYWVRIDSLDTCD